jgi:hypothetical protein
MRSDLQNMRICNLSAEELGYKYYGYMSSGSDASYIIMRETVATSEYKYAFGKGSVYTTAWSNRATLTYIFPNELTGKG